MFSLRCANQPNDPRPQKRTRRGHPGALVGSQRGSGARPRQSPAGPYAPADRRLDWAPSGWLAYEQQQRAEIPWSGAGHRVLQVLWDRIVPGGILILDDFGWLPYCRQFNAETEWFTARGHVVLEMPSGLGWVIKHA